MVDMAVRGAAPRVVLAFGLAVLCERGLVACGGESDEQNAARGGATGGGSGTGLGGTNAGGRSGSSAGGNTGMAGKPGTGGSAAVGGDGASGDGGAAGASGGEGGAGRCLDGPPLELEPNPVRRPWVDVGADHTCLLRRNGAITCWGANDFELEHDNFTFGAATPPAGTFIRLSTGLRSCALDVDALPVCWTDEDFANPPDEALTDVSIESGNACAILADGTLSCSRGGTEPSGEFVAVTDGARFACALARDGSIDCWGSVATNPPCGPFLQISAGGEHACGLRPDGSIACWGDDSFGQASPPSGTFSQISAGTEHTCALRRAGSVACWGAPDRTAAPTGTYVQVSAGVTHSCALRSDDKVICWGRREALQLDPPWEIAIEDETFTMVATGGAARAYDETDDPRTFVSSACGLRVDGSIDCFGGGGQPPAGDFVGLAVGPGAACALDAAEALSCWPMDSGSGVGVPPESLLSGTFIGVSIGNQLACAIRSGGELVCWDDGSEGDGAPPAGTFLAVSASGGWYLPGEEAFIGSDAKTEHACALRDDGAVLCWGYPSSESRRVDGPFVEVAAGYSEDCARRGDGSVVCWAANATSEVEPVAGTFLKIGVGGGFQGLKDDGTVVAADGRVLVNDTFVDFSVAGDFACGLRADGHVRCWGSRVR